ncbi:helicase C-terminal domain-containing protein [Anaerolineales bacterium HSG24]|nr:helicase C-terminal domain-containing protein [Anaerolineales bacterium HSG24]
MAQQYIALDIETTGFDPEQDAILEIGAVRFEDNQVLDSFETLINPGRPIPHNIQQLTGIKPDDVVDAPAMYEVESKLCDFVQNDPIVGHNIQFDLGFLREEGLFYNHASLDTFEIASILLPYANRYGLSNLLTYLEVDLPSNGQAHRALYDCQITHLLFMALTERAKAIDPVIILELVRLAKQAKKPWSLQEFFENVSHSQTTKPSKQMAMSFRGREDYEPDRILKPAENRRSIHVPYISKILQTDGLFGKAFNGYEHRPQQVDMLVEVAVAFNEGEHLIIEAGTGTGKSVAYLLPSIYWAIRNGERVVVSTNTLNLQDQLLNKDIPTLQEILPTKFKAVSLKGRSNYVCPKRVLMFQGKGEYSLNELRLLSKILVWLPQTKTGEKEELFMPNRAEQALWWQVASDGYICNSRGCTPDNCFYARAKSEAESAHIIIVNHALLLADVAVEGHVIPEYNYLVIDEAHHLEDSITNQLSFEADQQVLEQLLQELSQPSRDEDRFSGFIQEVLSQIRKVAPEKVRKVLFDLDKNSHQSVSRSHKAIHQLFLEINRFASGYARAGQYSQKIRLTESVREKNPWSKVMQAWENGSACLKKTSQMLSKINTLLVELENSNIFNWEEYVARCGLYRSNLDELRTKMHIVISEPNEQSIFWVEQEIKNDNCSLHLAPLHVGNLFHEHLLEPKECIVLTSATIRTNNSFSYYQERLHLHEIKQAEVGSPFDYRQNTLVYIPVDIPFPNAQNYLQVLSDSIIDLATRIGGRTLVLFTAYSQLKNVAKIVRKPLGEVGVLTFQQGTGASRRQLIDNFKNAEKAILLGTRSFWEGVDIPGPDLSCVIISKIPFAVPIDPVVSARSETFKNAFSQYSVPVAILSFRQGFGRLNRTKTDRGVVVIFDNRVINKSYGQEFINSLPEVTEYRGPLDNLPDMAQRWIDNNQE